MAGAPGTFEGASARLHVDTAAAFAKLRALRDFGRSVRAELAGMPTPVGAGRSGALPPAATGTIVGGNADAFKSNVVNKKSASTASKKLSTKTATPAVSGTPHIPEGPTHVAGQVSRGAFDKTHSAVNGSMAASIGAGQARINELNKGFAKGFSLEQEGGKIGDYSVSSAGVSLQSAFLRTVGPYAGYLALGYLGVKIAGAAGQGALNLVSEAAERGITTNALLKEKFSNIDESALDLGRDLSAGFYSLTEGISGSVRTGIAGAGALFAALADRDDVAQDFVLRNSVAQQDVQDFIARLRGEKTSKQLSKEAQQEKDVALQIAIFTADRLAEEQAGKVAEQMLGLGFTGTLDDIKAEVLPTIRGQALEKVHEDFFGNNGTRG